MVLARAEQTDEKLVITPMKSIGWDTVIFVPWMIVYLGAWLLFTSHRFLYKGTLLHSSVVEVMSILTPVVAISAALIRAKVRQVFWQWPARAFVFERGVRPEGRVALQTRDQGQGLFALRLIFVLPGLTGPDERKILETTVFSFARAFSHNPFAVARWESYPGDRLPDNAAEYEMVMLANRIHDYLGLQGSAPCKQTVTA